MQERFQHSKYQVNRQFFKLFGGKFRVYDPMGNLVLFSNMKAFKLKEDIRVYTGEDMATEILSIQARQIIDWSAAYDVVDSATGEKIGAMKRKGWKSMIKDEWVFMDNLDNEIGTIQEDTLFLAVLRRFLTTLIPQSYQATIQGKPVATYKQCFNPFLMNLTVDFSRDVTGLLDKRLGLAAAVLLCAIEGREKG